MFGSTGPTIEILGVYFPGWIIASVIGLVLSYACVRWLSVRPASRELGQSGLFFVSLALSSAMGFWWVFFSGF